MQIQSSYSNEMNHDLYLHLQVDNNKLPILMTLLLLKPLPMIEIGGQFTLRGP